MKSNKIEYIRVPKIIHNQKGNLVVKITTKGHIEKDYVFDKENKEIRIYTQRKGSSIQKDELLMKQTINGSSWQINLSKGLEIYKAKQKHKIAIGIDNRKLLSIPITNSSSIKTTNLDGENLEKIPILYSDRKYIQRSKFNKKATAKIKELSLEMI